TGDRGRPLGLVLVRQRAGHPGHGHHAAPARPAYRPRRAAHRERGGVLARPDRGPAQARRGPAGGVTARTGDEANFEGLPRMTWGVLLLPSTRAVRAGGR